MYETDSTTRVVTTERHELRLSGEGIRGLLIHMGLIIPERAEVRIYFEVPGGGDWSNTTIDIDDKRPVTVEWVIETVSEKKS